MLTAPGAGPSSAREEGLTDAPRKPPSLLKVTRAYIVPTYATSNVKSCYGIKSRRQYSPRAPVTRRENGVRAPRQDLQQTSKDANVICCMLIKSL